MRGGFNDIECWQLSCSCRARVAEDGFAVDCILPEGLSHSWW